MPNFGKVKQGMEKCKKYLKNVRVSMGELENSIRFFSSEEEKSQSKFEKYDRYLKERTYNEGEYNSPLLRTLNILESNHMDLTLIRSKLRN
jgi:predicted  nucleic acid-binding Zn-ribbon protein